MDTTIKTGAAERLLTLKEAAQLERERIRKMISCDGPGPAVPKPQIAPPDPGPIPACLDRRAAP
jgi:hypothetical protein